MRSRQTIKSRSPIALVSQILVYSVTLPMAADAAVLLLASGIEAAPAAHYQPVQLANTARRTTGSAFFVGSEGYLVTNAHVVAHCDDPRVLVGASEEPVKLVSIDPDIDLAILSSQNALHRNGFFLRPEFRLREPVAIFGFPLAPNFAENGRATVGVVLGRSDDGRRLLTNAPVQAGNSGSPVLDQSGAVIGVVFGKNASRTFAVSAAAIRDAFAKENLSVPVAREGEAISVADVLKKTRMLSGKINCQN